MQMMNSLDFRVIPKGQKDHHYHDQQSSLSNSGGHFANGTILYSNDEYTRHQTNLETHT